MRGEWTKLEATLVAPPPEKADGEKEFRKERPTSASDIVDVKSCWSDMHRPTLLEWVRSSQEFASFGAFGAPRSMDADAEGNINGSASLYGGKPDGGKDTH